MKLQIHTDNKNKDQRGLGLVYLWYGSVIRNYGTIYGKVEFASCYPKQLIYRTYLPA